jgi:nonribosomal peptide synthetase protein BlmVI
MTPRLTPVPTGGTGELTIGGIALATGYLDPAPTAAAFVPDPRGRGQRLYRTGDVASRRENGAYDLHGRLDRQVKVRGQRIELAEIERVAEQLDEVTAAVATVAPNERGETMVTLQVVARPSRLDEVEVRRHLRRQLPAAFIPHHVMVVSHLTVGRHGKLRPPPVGRSEGRPGSVEPPRSVDIEPLAGSGEGTVAMVMAQVLERSSVGRHQSFYDLGGDSLLALRVVAELRRLGRDVHVVDLMGQPTPAGLAEVGVGHRPTTVPAPAPFELLPDSSLSGAGLVDAHPASSTDAALLFLARADQRHETYVTSLRLRGRVRPLAWEVAFQSLLARHPYLRSSFELVDGRWVQAVRSECLEVALRIRGASATRGVPILLLSSAGELIPAEELAAAGVVQR